MKTTSSVVVGVGVDFLLFFVFMHACARKKASKQTPHKGKRREENIATKARQDKESPARKALQNPPQSKIIVESEPLSKWRLCLFLRLLLP
jgi:hypothetical protein